KTHKLVRNGKMSLLGRAFRPEVADAYRRKAREDEKGYAWLDLHAEDEVFHPSFDEIARFLEEGSLASIAGGGR
ncbi:MAG: hypothetical protein V3T72_21905, partial [Thermoanaerobaculia bacterium]